MASTHARTTSVHRATLEAIYLDHPATTACDAAVLEAMLPWLVGPVGNSGQVGHARGRAARAAVDRARAQVLAAVGAPAGGDVVFTSGATEANNLVLLGAGRTLAPGSRVVVGATEHASVLAPARLLAAAGLDVRVVEVDSHGVLRLDAMRAALAGGAALVSVQVANNETGVLQDLEGIARAARAAGALVHADAVQAFTKVSLRSLAPLVDFVTISGHKVHGPQGVGAIVATSAQALGRLTPTMHGGGQEHGLRPGTVNVPGAVGLGEAARIGEERREADHAHCTALRDRLEARVLAHFDRAVVNGTGALRGPAISSITLPGLDARRLLEGAPHVIAGTTSACSAGGVSHVLRAMGLDRRAAASTMRLGVGRCTTVAEVDAAVDALVASAARIGAAHACREAAQPRSATAAPHGSPATVANVGPSGPSGR
ncbi:MAG: hypothetical protein JWM98_1053 [Thermoleophilia bacterium]|nr:hypothetical protein [Thermoleophilia bacterium]